MIKTLPFSGEEQNFIAKTISHGVLTGLLDTDQLVLGSIAFVVTLIFFIKSYKQHNQNPHAKFASIILWVIAYIFIFLSVISILNKMTPLGIATDLCNILSQVIQLIAMIVMDPHHWWRYLLLMIPAMFIPRFIRNLFQKRPWHFSSIGKIFGNMYAGAAFTIMSFGILAITGKSRKRIERERREEELKKLRINE